MKKYIALLWLCCLTVGIRAAVQIKAAAPDVVEEGDRRTSCILLSYGGR